MFELFSVIVMFLIFLMILLVWFIALHDVLPGQERSYYKLSKTVPNAVNSPKVIEK